LRFPSKWTAKALEQEALTDGGLPPSITNLEPADYPAKRVLEIYKFQTLSWKNGTGNLKPGQELTPVLLKKDERVVAYLHLHVMALMVATLIEPTTVSGPSTTITFPSLPLYPENRPCRISHDVCHCARVSWRRTLRGGGRRARHPLFAKLDRLQRQVLEVAGRSPISALS